MSHPSVGQWKFACLIIAQRTVKTSSNPPVRIAMGITLDKMLKVLSFWYTRSTCIRTLATRFVLAMSFDVKMWRTRICSWNLSQTTCCHQTLGTKSFLYHKLQKISELFFSENLCSLIFDQEQLQFQHELHPKLETLDNC